MSDPAIDPRYLEMFPQWLRGLGEDAALVGDAVAATRSPSRALEMKLAEQSTVVKLRAPSGQWWLTPKAHRASAMATTTGAHRKPVPAIS